MENASKNGHILKKYFHFFLINIQPDRKKLSTKQYQFALSLYMYIKAGEQLSVNNDQLTVISQQ